MSKRRRICQVSGKTEDKVLLVRGVFALSDTHGIPMDLTLDKLRDLGLMCDWMQFYRDAMAQGWTPKRALSKLREAVGDVYGPDWREEWEVRMNAWIRRYHATQLEEEDPHELLEGR